MISHHLHRQLPKQLDNFNHISFSFDNRPSEEREPRKTIDQYLRLKTNQSIQEKCNLPGKRSLCYRKPLRSQEAETDNEYHLQLKNDEQQLRIESLTKQYELKLAKQEEFFSLREWKLNEEIQNLTLQVGSLNEEVRRLRVSGKQQSSHCALCSDGQVINHLTAVLRQAQENHKHCLDDKKQMTRRLDSSTGRLQSLEEEHEKICQQYKNLNKQMRISNTQIRQLESQRNQLKQFITQQQNDMRAKIASYEASTQDLLKKINYMEDRREEQSIANSKATLQSTHTVLTNIDNKLNRSYMNPRNSLKDRSSVAKMLIEEDHQNENYNYYRKMSGSSKCSSKYDASKGTNKMDGFRMKFF